MIKGKQKALSRFLMFTGLDRAFRNLQEPGLMVFNFHRIKGDDPSEVHAFDEEVFGPTESEFRAQMLWLKANADLISENDLLSFLAGKIQLPARSAMVTFDDGYIDNYTLAFPHLKDLRIPAIYFIPTEAIEEREIGWWDLIAFVLKRTQKESALVNGERIPILPDREAARVRLLEMLKRRSAKVTENVVKDLADACGVPLPSKEETGRELMTWDQLRELLKSGISIGSHCHSQRPLATLDLKEQEQELSRSKSRLEERLPCRIRTLAYPVGGYEHFNLETKDLARQLGYEAAFSFTHEINRLPIEDPFNIRRLVPPEELPLYCGLFALPKLFARRRSEAATLAPCKLITNCK